MQTGSTSITYAKTGAKASESNTNVTKNYSYDGLGRLISETETGGIVKTYGYDIGDNRTSMTLTVSGVQQMSMGYTYDIAKRLSTVSEGGAQQASYSYDANGNRLSLTYPNGNTTSYTYNIGNMVTRLENKQGSTILSAYDYAYYLDGDQRSKADNTGKATAYVYDSLGRLKSETESGTTSSSISYTYDLNSNRSAMTVDSAEDYVVYYWYDARNRLLFTVKSQGTANTGTAYFYDGNGNTISTKEAGLASSNYAAEMAAMRASVPTAVATGVTLYGYDGYNRQTSVSSSATTSTYTYNPDGLRKSKTVDGVVTRHIWEGQNIVAELDGNGAVTNRYIRGINLIAGKNSSSVLTYYLFNVHGDVVGLTNTSGAVTKSYDYDAFGNEKSIVSTDTNPFRYCGEYLDLSSGTYYLRARYYDPTIGRFLSEDTHWNTSNSIYGDDPLMLNKYTAAPDMAAITQSSNLYVYCGNNPIIYVDSDGHVFMLVTAAIGAVVGGAVGAIYSYSKTGSVTWQSVAAGAAIGGAIGLTGGAAASLLATAGSAGGMTAFASTATVQAGLFGAAAGATAASGTGYATFQKLKDAIGSAGSGYQWHHIVEQSQIAKSGFSNYVINNTQNIIRVSNEIHAKISGYYNTTTFSFTGGLSVRNWLAGQDFQTQYEFGLEVLKKYGVIN